MIEDRCDRCGHPFTIGDWPFCPHGRSTLATIPDDVPGGFTVENGFDTPRTFYSRSAHRAALAAEGYEQRVKWAGPGDQHVTRWDTVDLDSARQLLERGPQARKAKVAADAVITVRDVGGFTKADLDG